MPTATRRAVMHRSFTRPIRLSIVCPAVRAALPASAQDTDGARRFRQDLADQALSVLARDDISAQQATDDAKQLLRRGFDLPTIGRFATGRLFLNFYGRGRSQIRRDGTDRRSCG